MSFCDFVPNDPSCQTPDPEPVTPTPIDGGNENMDGGMDMGMDYPPKMEENGMQGNLTYLHVALFGFIHGGLELFRYHDDTEYDNGDFMSTNIWEMAGQLHHYSHFGIMGLLTVTQILSMVGVAGEINIMAWMYMEMLEMVLGLVVKLMRMYVYESAYSTVNDTSASSADQTKAGTVMSEVMGEMTETLIEHTASHLALHVEHENWMHGQVMMLPEEAQAKYMDHSDSEDEDDHMLAFVQKKTGYFRI